MQTHYSGVGVKFLEVEVKLENWMNHYSSDKLIVGRLSMQVYLHYSQPERRAQREITQQWFHWFYCSQT